MQLAINIGGAGDYSSDETFANLFLNSRSPQQQNWNNPQVRIGIDAQGWPTEDFRQVIYGNLVVYYVTNGGTYAIKFTGIATLVPNPNGTITSQSYDPATNTTTATLVGIGNRNDFWVDFTGTKRNPTAALNSGITNIFIMRPIAEGSSTPHNYGEFLSRNFTNFVANSAFVAFRFMDFLATNSYPTATYPTLAWAQRTPGYAPNQSGYYTSSIGTSIELCCKVCNATHKDLYVNVPDVANDDYILKFLQTIAFGSDGTNPYTSLQSSPAYPPLDPSLKVYLEWGNELWNFGYPFIEAFTRNRNSAVSEAAAGDPIGYDGHTDITTLGQRRVARKIAYISTVARGVFGDAQMMVRVRPVLMGFDVTSGIQKEGLRFLQDFYQQKSTPSHPVNYYLYGAGNGTYRSLTNADGSGATSATVLLASGIAPDLNGAELLPRFYHSYGLKAISYEGALEVGGDAVTEFTYATNLDPRMRPLVKDYYDRLARAGYDLPFIFQTDGGNYAQSRSSEPADVAIGPKYLAALDFMASGASYTMPDFVNTSIFVTEGTSSASTPLLQQTYNFPTAGILTILMPGRQTGTTPTLALSIDGIQVATSTCADAALLNGRAYSFPFRVTLAAGSHAILVVATAPVTVNYQDMAYLSFAAGQEFSTDYELKNFASAQPSYISAVTPPTPNYGAELTLTMDTGGGALTFINIAGVKVGFFYNTFGVFTSSNASIQSQSVLSYGGVNGVITAEVRGTEVRTYVNGHQLGDPVTITPVSGPSGFVGYSGTTLPQFRQYTLQTATSVPAPTGGTIPAALDVRFGVAVGLTTGLLRVPTAAQVQAGVLIDATTGTYDPVTGNYSDPGVVHVQSATTYKFAGATLTGTYAGSGAAVTQSGDTYALLASLLTNNALSTAALVNMPKSGYSLAAAGLDQVIIETGVNARQTLATILAACAGIVAGAGTGVVVIKGGNTSTTRITAITDNAGNRSSVTLTLPS